MVVLLERLAGGRRHLPRAPKPKDLKTKTMPMSTTLRIAAFSAVVLSIGGCGLFDSSYPDKQAGKTEPSSDEQSSGSLFIPFPRLWGGDSTPAPSNPVNAGVGVNGYLWRASLDTLSFLPLSSADPFGGVLITEWYAPPETPNERFKATVTISDRELRADAIHVALFRQTRAAGGTWADATVNPRTKTEIENAILTRARELRSTATAAARK